MPVSIDSVICPYCKTPHSKSVIQGTSGLINHNGTERSVTCRRCGKDFTCVMTVTIKFKTIKEE